MHLDHQKILEKYKSYNITVDEAKIKKAVEFAIKYHGTFNLYHYTTLYVYNIIQSDTYILLYTIIIYYIILYNIVIYYIPI